MQFRNKKQIAYFTSLCLILSYAEFLLPRVVPFFRLGLSNAVILSALFLDFPSFFILCVAKAVVTSMISGTLFSVFFLLSVSQSVCSGLVMYVMNKITRIVSLNSQISSKKLISIYGFSFAGSAVSSVVQILISDFYIGHGVYSFLGLMLLFSIFSGFVTARISENLSQNIEKYVSKFELKMLKTESELKNFSSWIFDKKRGRIIFFTLMICFLSLIFCIESVGILCFFLVISVVLQLIFKRRILIFPHVFLWIFILLSSIFIPNGKVLLHFWKFSVTDGALLSGIIKALKISASMCISQCFSFTRLFEFLKTSSSK